MQLDILYQPCLLPICRFWFFLLDFFFRVRQVYSADNIHDSLFSHVFFFATILRIHVSIAEHSRSLH